MIIDINELLKKSDSDLIKTLAETTDQDLIDRNFKEYAQVQIKYKEHYKYVADFIRYVLQNNKSIPYCCLPCDM